MAKLTKGSTTDPVRGSTEGFRPETVHLRTGKTLDEWQEVLDAFDVKSNGHKAASAFLSAEHGVAAWWAQTLVIHYEQTHGLRSPGQRHDGKFAVNVSRTIAAAPDRAFAAWSTSEGWNGWFTTRAEVDFRVGGAYGNADGDRGVFTRIVPPGPPNSYGEVARIEFTWDDQEHCPGSRVTVQFLAKSEASTQVAVTHDRLRDREGVDDMKPGWTWALVSLKSWLETGDPVPHEEWLKTQARS